MYLRVPVSVSVCKCVREPTEARRVLDLLELRLQVMWAMRLERWEPNEFSPRAVGASKWPSLLSIPGS